MRCSALLPLLLALSACAPFASQPDLPALTEPALPALPPAWQSAADAVGDVEVGWIARIGDSRLDTLVVEALANNRDLLAAAAAVAQARAQAAQAGAPLLPAIDYSASAAEGGRVADSSSDSYSAGFALSWELDVWGRVRASRNAATYILASAEADYVFSQYSLAAAVAQLYFLVIESRLQQDVAQKSFDTLARTARIVRVQREFGEADAYDDSLAEANLASARATLAQSSGNLRLAVRALEVLLGRYPANALTGPIEFPRVPAVPGSGLPSELVARRPDIIAAEMSIAAAFSNLGATKATRLPRFSLSGSIDGSASSFADAFDPDNSTWALATNLLGPLFDAGLRRAQVEEANASQREAIASFAAVALTAFQEVENSIDQNAVLAVRVAALADAAAAQNRALELAELRYQEGQTDLLDVLTVQSNTLNADSALVSARREQIDEWINLNLALGGSWKLRQ